MEIRVGKVKLTARLTAAPRLREAPRILQVPEAIEAGRPFEVQGKNLQGAGDTRLLIQARTMSRSATRLQAELTSVEEERLVGRFVGLPPGRYELYAQVGEVSSPPVPLEVRAADAEPAPAMVQRRLGSVALRARAQATDISRRNGFEPVADGLEDLGQLLEQSSGEALPASTIQFMQALFRADLSEVRVHTDPSAQRAADALGADAFAQGDSIFFAQGRYDPTTPRGQALLGHELTHVVQDREGRVARDTQQLHGLSVTGVSDPLEQAAYHNERVIYSGLASSNLNRAEAMVGKIRRKATAGLEGVGRAARFGTAHARPVTLRRSASASAPSAGTVRASGGAAGDVPFGFREELGASQGSYLPRGIQQDFERLLGSDFSRVKVHTDPSAQVAAEMVGAEAFTLGEAIFFNTGRFAPNSAHGMALLAHELTHVAQEQGGAPTLDTVRQGPLLSGGSGSGNGLQVGGRDQLEEQAERNEKAVLQAYGSGGKRAVVGLSSEGQSLHPGDYFQGASSHGAAAVWNTARRYVAAGREPQGYQTLYKAGTLRLKTAIHAWEIVMQYRYGKGDDERFNARFGTNLSEAEIADVDHFFCGALISFIPGIGTTAGAIGSVAYDGVHSAWHGTLALANYAVGGVFSLFSQDTGDELFRKGDGYRRSAVYNAKQLGGDLKGVAFGSTLLFPTFDETPYQRSEPGAAPQVLPKMRAGYPGSLALKAEDDAGGPVIAPAPVKDAGIDQVVGMFRTLGKGVATLADIGIGFIPIVGDVYDVLCAIVGRAILTWQQLDVYERLLCLVGVIPIPFVSGAILRRGKRALGWVLSETKAARLLAKAMDRAVSFVKSRLTRIKTWFSSNEVVNRLGRGMRRAVGLPLEMVRGISSSVRRWQDSKKGGGEVVKRLQDGVERLGLMMQKHGYQNTTQAAYYEYRALRSQGYSAQQAHELMKRFRAGEKVEGFAFHFADMVGGQGIKESGRLRAGKGYLGQGVYAGSNPTPSAFQQRVPIVGWGLDEVREVRIPVKTAGKEHFKAVLPTQTYLFEVAEDMPLNATGKAFSDIARTDHVIERLWHRWKLMLFAAGSAGILGLSAFQHLLFKEGADASATRLARRLRGITGGELPIPGSEAWDQLPRREQRRLSRVIERLPTLEQPGLPLEWSLRNRLESEVGADLSMVRLHTGADAEDLAGDLEAQAFALGERIVFGPGTYSPESVEGMGTLVHEVTHVVQDAQGRVAGPGSQSRTDQLEAEAYAAERRYVARARAQQPSAPPPAAGETLGPQLGAWRGEAAPQVEYRHAPGNTPTPAPEAPKKAVPEALSKALRKEVRTVNATQDADPVSRVMDDWRISGMSRDEFLEEVKDRLMELLHDEVALDAERRETTISWNPYGASF